MLDILAVLKIRTPTSLQDRSVHGRSFLLIGLILGLITPVLAQKPAIVLEASELPAPSQRRADDKGDLALRWENLKFLFAGPDKMTRGEITEAQVTVFDRASHRRKSELRAGRFF